MFGSWQKTFDHVYTNGWLKHFCDMLRANRDWIETTTLARVADNTLPLGKLYLPDGSYREMTEWALEPKSLQAFRDGAERFGRLPDTGEIKRFFRAGGYWRNFKARYPESDEMYVRMMGISRRLATVLANPSADPDYLEVARQELYRGQCNCPYWHGSFGGLYLPHLRNAIYRGLITAHNALDEAEGRSGPRVSLEVGDFNLDARQEVCLESDRLIVWVRPALGGHIYELDVRENVINLLATLDRRPEVYHAAIVAAAAERAHGHDNPDPGGGSETTAGRITLKQEGLGNRLVYDRYPRKALVDHFYSNDVTLDDLIACRETELGDFALGTYLAKAQRDVDRVALVMERPGLAAGHSIRLKKTIELVAGARGLSVHYELDELPAGVGLHFAVEINLAAMAGHAPDRFYSDPAGTKLGLLDDLLDLPHIRGLSLTDQWLELAVGLAWSKSAGLWCFPMETVSQSDGGVERVYQSSTIIPHWNVIADDGGRWDVWVRWTFDRTTAVKPSQKGSSVPAPVSAL
jgi:hypothetical protein